jgi:periplasmic protein TonB
MVLLLILQAATATIPPPVVPPPGAKNLVTILSADDYPAEAVRNRWQGDVVVDLRISREGRPRWCRIVQSSGYPVLDQKTCEILLHRARFVPARDSRGQPAEDVYRTPAIKWRLEGF